jgi:alkylhydroperoxidase family enzyme
MPRVGPAPDATQASPYLQVLAHCPEIAEKWSALGTTVRFGGVLPPELKEEVRRSTASQIGCVFCASFGDAKVEHADEREALAVRLARTIADDPKLVDDALFDELRRHFTDQEIVELVATISFVVVGGQTFGAVMGIESASAEYALVYEQWVEDNMASTTASSA